MFGACAVLVFMIMHLLDTQVNETCAQVNETSAQLNETSAQVNETSAQVNGKGVAGEQNGTARVVPDRPGEGPVYAPAPCGVGEDVFYFYPFLPPCIFFLPFLPSEEIFFIR